MTGFVYILECDNGLFYTGSTINLEKRLAQHWNGQGANFTKKYSPVRLVHVEVYDRIDTAFYREKQIQRWSHSKKEALIAHNSHALKSLAACQNSSHFLNQRVEKDDVYEVDMGGRC